MRGFFETYWQSIQFSELNIPLTKELPGVDFYNAFYQELFHRYNGYEELDITWRRQKRELAEWIANHFPGQVRVLSIGCGLGYMEYHIHRMYPLIELHVQDFASDALIWLQRELPESCVHLLCDMQDKTHTAKYNLIYLSAVDYALENDALINLLQNARRLLNPGGRCLLVSASFLECMSVTEWVKRGVKDGAKWLLEMLGLYSRGQFWGWQRNQLEYRELMCDSGYVDVYDGFIQTPNQKTYFIFGSIPTI